MKSLVRREAVFAICLAGGAAVAFFGARATLASHPALTPIAVTPFSLQTDIYKASSNTLELKKVHKKARRSDGTTAELDSVGNVDWNLFARKVTTLDGEAHGIIDALQMVSSYKMRQKELQLLRYRLQTPPVDCVFEGMQHVTQEMYGQVLLDVNTEDLGNGLRATDRLAPKLGCEVIASDLDKLVGGVYEPVTEEHIVSLVIGQPNADLFGPWGLYRESKLSDMKRAAFVSRGVSQTECDKCDSGLKRMDQRHEQYMDEASRNKTQ